MDTDGVPGTQVMRCIRRGTVVYKEGDAPDYFHLIFSGGVAVRV